MNLYLVRHGKAVSKEEDALRPLSERGKEETAKVAAFLGANPEVIVKAIFHSGKLRAKQTAEAIAEKLRPPEGIQETNGLTPEADPSIWAGRLEETTDDIMLVGHLPHLAKLLSLLLVRDENKSLIAFSTSAVVCLGKGISDNWQIRWILTPEMLSE